MTTKIKSYCDNFVIHLGPMRSSGLLIPLHNSAVKKDAKFFSVTPDGKKVSQRYIDDDGNLFKPGELKKGMTNPDDGHVIVVDKEYVKEATASPLPKNVLNLTVHSADEVSGKVFPAKSQVVYVFEPHTRDPSNVKWHDMILGVLENSDTALMGVCNLQNNEGVFRLLHFQGRIVVQKQTPPEQLIEHDPVEPEITAQELEAGLKTIGKMVTPFDPADYQDQQVERCKALKEAAVEGAELKPVESPVPTTVDILSVLDDFEV